MALTDLGAVGSVNWNLNLSRGANDINETIPRARTLTPMVTSSTVIALVYNDGVIMAADSLGSYGTLARFKRCRRVIKVNETTAIGVSGDYADFQYLESLIQEMTREEEVINDGLSMSPKNVFNYLARYLYHRRSKFDPLWTTVVVAGLQNNKPFLGYVDKIGTAYEAPSIATGFGGYLIQPLLRPFYEGTGVENIDLKTAKQFMKKCMTTLFYRDCKAYSQYDMVSVSRAGAVEIEHDLKVEPSWDIAAYVK